MKKPNQLFSGKTIKLIKVAINKWYNICYLGGIDKDCKLCEKFIEEDCRECPIWEITGYDCMELPEYSNWHKYVVKCGVYVVFDKQSLLNAEAELEFIEKIFRKALLFWDIKGDYMECVKHINIY